MEKKEIDKLRERLRWFIYECPYSEYNEQEVNYILDKLKECNDEYENEITSSYFSFHSNILHNGHQNIQNRSKKNAAFIVFGTLGIASSLFIAVFARKQSIAGLKTGLFNFLERDENKVQFYIAPEENKKYRVFRLEEVPDALKETVWIPDTAFMNEYILSYIELNSKSVVSILLENTNKNKYIEIFYNRKFDVKNNENNAVENFYYRDTYVEYILINHKAENKKYYFTFSHLQIDYTITSNNFEDAKSLICDYIDFLTNK